MNKPIGRWKRFWLSLFHPSICWKHMKRKVCSMGMGCSDCMEERAVRRIKFCEKYGVQ